MKPTDETTPRDLAAALYTGVQGWEYHEKKRALHPSVLPWVMALRAEKFQPHVSRTDVVFEFGVGSAWNLGKLLCGRKLGFDTAGFLKERVMAAGVEFVDDVAAVRDETADVAICHQTLEHLLQPGECLRQLKRILKANGKLLLHVPWERERRYASYRADEPNHHLYTWNAQNIGNLASLLSFKIESIKTQRYGYDRFAANVASRLKIGEQGFRVLRACMVAVRPFWEIELIARS